MTKQYIEYFLRILKYVEILQTFCLENHYDF